MLDDPLFRTSVRNNLVLMACVPVMIVMALVLALLLSEQRKAAPLYRFILFTPYIISITVTGIAFSAMLTKNGALNQMLSGRARRVASGLAGGPEIALFSVGGVIIWREAVLGWCSSWPGCSRSRPSHSRRRWSTAPRAGGRTGR